jgi:hypothetical protein
MAAGPACISVTGFATVPQHWDARLSPGSDGAGNISQVGDSAAGRRSLQGKHLIAPRLCSLHRTRVPQHLHPATGVYFNYPPGLGQTSL